MPVLNNMLNKWDILISYDMSLTLNTRPPPQLLALPAGYILLLVISHRILPLTIYIVRDIIPLLLKDILNW